MKKAAIITLSILSAAIFVSCSSARTSCNGYNGVNNQKAVKKQQKEFQKPKHKLKKISVKTKN